MRTFRIGQNKYELLNILLVFHCFSIDQVSPLMCLSCHQSIQPRHCHSISYCADDEKPRSQLSWCNCNIHAFVCFVERVESNYGVRYNTGCLQRPVCEEQNNTLHIHSNSDGNLAPPTCTECCHTDLCNAQGCGQPGYPRLQERGPVCLACSQLFDNQECREIAHCRNSELCFIKEESEFGDKVYSSGCMPFQQCISIVSNTHAVTDLSNMHHYTYSTTTKLMTSASSTKLLTSAHTNLPTSASPTKSQTPTPGNTTDISTSVHTSALPTSVTTMSTTVDLMGIAVVGRRQERQKRYTSCEHCCRGDLCNNACVHHSKITPTPHFFTGSPRRR